MKTRIVIILFISISSMVKAQTSTADEYLQNGDLDKAASSYLEYLSANPHDSLAAFKLGRTYAGLEMWTESEKYYRKALQGHFPITIINYQLARNQMSQENYKMAFDLLQAGADAGMRNYIALMHDPLFEPLRTMEEWSGLIKKVENNTYPCLNKEEYRHFDFWLGSWNVLRNGQKIGENVITRANGGCAIHESYTTYPRDYTGQSINFYDPLEKRWHQHWVGSGGDVTNYYETKKDEGMIQFTGKVLGRSGNVVINRMTFTRNTDGTVRQLIESSQDQGESWSVSFDGLYVKKVD